MGTYRPCAHDVECDSAACGFAGRCILETDVVYVSATSTIDSGACTHAAPCRNVVFAGTRITATRNHVALLPGTHVMRVAFLTGAGFTEVYIHGNGSTLVHDSTANGAILVFGIPIATLRDATFQGASPGGALTVISGSLRADTIAFRNTGALSLLSAATGVVGDLAASDATDMLGAVKLSGPADLTVNRGTISCGFVAIAATPARGFTFAISSSSTQFGRALDVASATGELEFSTFSDVGRAQPTPPCAIACNPNLRVTSSIVWQPTCNGATADATGPCTFQSSIVSNASGLGITNVDPQFVDELLHDYHIRPTSPAKDAVDTGPALDVDGDVRPQGARFDLGADEARQ
jgi:hypothetical protein